MKKFFLLLVSFLIGVGLFIWISGVVGWEEIKNSFLVFTGWKGLAILVLTLIMAILGTLKWREILRAIGIKLSFKNLFNPYLAGYAIMLLAPIMIWGGEVFRTYILRKRNLISWQKGMASVIIDRILEWTANLTVIFFGGLFFLFFIGFPPTNLALIFGGLFLTFVAAISFFYFKCIRRESILKFFIKNNQPFETEKEIFNFFKPKKMTMWNGFILSFLRAGVMWFRAWLLILFLGKTIGALPALAILGFNYLAVMIPIPTALGSHEAIQTLAFNSLGLDTSLAPVFTMIIRGAELIVALVGVIILFRLGIIFLKNLFFKKLEDLANKNEF